MARHSLEIGFRGMRPHIVEPTLAPALISASTITTLSLLCLGAHCSCRRRSERRRPAACVSGVIGCGSKTVFGGGAGYSLGMLHR